MDIDKALGIARSLKNHYRAFEELDAFVVAVAATQGNMGELESRKKALEKEIATLEAKKTNLAEMEAAHAKMEEETNKAQEILNGLRSEIDKIKSKLG
jgi:type VII secretion effector (TIGR04197 family)